MATFPGAVPSYTASDPSKTLYQDGHAARHNAVQDDVSAIATKLGTGASTPSANTVLRGTGAGASAYGKVALASEVSGVLPVANGGTGASTSTGSGAVVLATSPTLTTPVIGSFASANHDHTNSAGGGTLNGGSAIQSGTITGDRMVANTVTPDKMLGIDLFAVGNALDGSAPSAGTGQFYIQAGTSVVTTNGSGTGSFNWATAFPNGLLGAVAVEGDTTAGNNHLRLFTSTKTGTSFNFQGMGANTVRLNWIAIGF